MHHRAPPSPRLSSLRGPRSIAAAAALSAIVGVVPAEPARAADVGVDRGVDAKAAGAAVALDVLPPGCLDPWQRVLLLAPTVGEPITRRGGRFAIVASGPDALAAADVVVFPADGAPAVADIPTNLVDDGAVDVLETPFERIVVEQAVPGVDLLALIEDAARASGGRFPDVVRRRVPRLRADGVVGLQLGPGLATTRMAGADRRETAARFTVELDGHRGVLVAVSRSLGGPERVHRALVDGAAEGPRPLRLFAGGARGATCTTALAALGVDAAVPRSVDLGALAAPLVTAGGAALPWLAANVVDTSGARPWPGQKSFVVDGRRVVVIGLVGSGEFTRAPDDVRARLRVRSGRDALAAEVAALRRAPEGPPDLVVVLSSGDGAERAQLAAVDGIDVVVADFSRDDGLPLQATWSPTAPREQSRHDALVQPTFHRAGLGRIVARFAPGAPAVLRDVVVTVDPLLDDGALSAPSGPSGTSAAFAAPLRHDEDARAASGAAVLVPAVATLVDSAREAAAPLVWGDRVAVLGEERRRVAGDAVIWTDDLWLRVVGNAIARSADADVALVRNMRRAPLVAGPLSRATVESWLVDVDGVVVLEQSGAELVRLAERLAAAPAIVDDASGLIAVSGLDAARRIVGGRPIEPLARYRVAVDERLRGDPRLVGVLDGTGTRLADGAVAAVVAGLAAPAGVDADDADDADRLVQDRARVRATEWRLGVQGLDLRGQAVRTSANLRALAPSLETRAAQRDLLLVSARLQAFALLDAPGFAWDNQLRLQYDATFFTDGGPGPPVIEPFDDVVGTTEVRADLLRLPLPGDAPLLAVFVNATGDGEVTPAPGLRRQAQLREATGLALTMTGPLRELRLGVVAQQDLSTVVDPQAGGDRVFNDAGVLGLVRAGLLLPGGLVLDSVNDARFFFGDDDDRPFDLALRAQSVTRLTAPLTPSIGGFVFVDVVALTPKPSPIAVEWNAVVGAGITFGNVWRW